MFSDLHVPLENKGIQLGSSYKQAPPSKGKNTNMVLAPSPEKKCEPTDIFRDVDIPRRYRITKIASRKNASTFLIFTSFFNSTKWLC